MPEYRIAGTVVNVSRNAVLLDTSILVAAFWRGETPDRRATARYLLEYEGRPLLVPSVVVVETWGMVVRGRRDLHDDGMTLLSWLNSPGRATIIPPYRSGLDGTEKLAGELKLDCVDAMLVELATDITDHCELRPPLPIASFDQQDFLRIFGRSGVRLALFDPETREIIAYQ